MDMNKKDTAKIEPFDEALRLLKDGISADAVIAQRPELTADDIELLHLAQAIRNLPILEPQLIPAEKLIPLLQDKEKPPEKDEGNFIPWLGWKPVTMLQQVFSQPRRMGAVFTLMAILLVSVLFIGRGMLTDNSSARLQVVQGDVYLSSQQGEWKLVQEDKHLVPGDKVYTAIHSEATVLFSDGSKMTLKPNSAITIVRASALPETGIQVSIIQSRGTTQHDVVPFRSAESRYEVITPSGKVSVHGTVFSVHVSADKRAEVEVQRGEVEFMGNQRSVVLVAGQATTSGPASDPEPPAYTFKLEGYLEELTAEYGKVSGVLFWLDADTVMEGNPQPGDYVEVKGRIEQDGRWVATKIELSNAVEVEGKFTGVVEEIGETSWKISGQTIAVDSNTRIDGEILVGTPVEVKFVVLSDDTWLATKITALFEDDGDATPTPTEPIVETEPPPTEAADCVGAEPQPHAMQLAQQFGVSYEEIMAWFCSGYGFGEIELAYQMSVDYNVTVGEIFAMRVDGMGWGQIKAYFEPTRTPKPSKTPKPEKTPGPPEDNPASDKAPVAPPGLENKPTKQPKPTRKTGP